MTNLVLCGGGGTRLWPLSRRSRPKQFSRLFGPQTTFQETLERNHGLADRLVVATAAPLVDEVRAQLDGQSVTFLVEPVPRNTAAAIALVCLSLPADEIVLVTPSDHRITRLEAYRQAVTRARELARDGSLVALGLKPASAQTGFGYLEAEGERVLRFCEKPDRATAEAFVASGRHWWNSGIYVFRAGDLLEELAAHAPDVAEACRAVATLQPSREQMLGIPSISIDYAVMEKTARLSLVTAELGWSDIGSFEALHRLGTPDADGNVVLGGTSAHFVHSARSLVVGHGRPVVLSNVSDLVIIDTPDALLVTRRGSGPLPNEVREGLPEDLL